MVSFADKPVWDDSEWQIFFARLDVLRKRDGLLKKGLSRRIGVTNIYRRDRAKPHPLTIDKICATFGVTKKWLCDDNPGAHLEREKHTHLGDSTHESIIGAFKNKDIARKINLELLRIESLDHGTLDRVLCYLQGIRETLERFDEKNRTEEN